MAWPSHISFEDINFPLNTWQKHFVDEHPIWERLDRGLANNNWFLKFSSSKIHHLQFDSLDHYPLWIIPNSLEVPCITKPFRFQEMWLSDRDCSDNVEAVWYSNEVAYLAIKVIRKLEKCGKELGRRNRNHFGNVRRDLVRKKKELVEVEKVAMSSGNNFQLEN